MEIAREERGLHGLLSYRIVTTVTRLDKQHDSRILGKIHQLYIMSSFNWIRLHWKCLVDRIDGQLNSIHHSLEVAFRCARHDSQCPFTPKYSLQVPNKSFEVHPLGCTLTTQVLCRQHQISSSSCYCLQQCNIKEHPFPY